HSDDAVQRDLDDGQHRGPDEPDLARAAPARLGFAPAAVLGRADAGADPGGRWPCREFVHHRAAVAARYGGAARAGRAPAARAAVRGHLRHPVAAVCGGAEPARVEARRDDWRTARRRAVRVRALGLSLVRAQRAYL